MQKQAINELIKQIKEDIFNNDDPDEQFREITIVDKSLEENVQLIVDNDFGITFFDNSVLMKYTHTDDDDGDKTNYRHLFVLKNIDYITDEV